ncbi:uncharacterized protein LOC106874790 [Octopus bimaculoides]|uniref:uncharacterized protein LOC106874790 n=1 Tax=Octopus bimaculoides TaxID=37653 RepID=UPI00071C2BE2|nr:uncharacterized protein LOC106874790 [Octopus bimaculoides]|eukprot:XP_014778129.1 PREDICTED: uncharacterized protein LOC106874790 [Octopus bimaculoides]
MEKTHQLFHEDHWRTNNNIADVVGLLYGSMQAIVTSELNTWHISAKFVSRLQTTELKEYPAGVYQDLRQCAADNPSFTSRIITSDKNWVYRYDPEMKQQPKSPSSPQQKKA